jgi:hypothetical protein
MRLFDLRVATCHFQYYINLLLYNIVGTRDMWPLDILRFDVSGTHFGEYYVITFLYIVT